MDLLRVNPWPSNYCLMGDPTSHIKVSPRRARTQCLYYRAVAIFRAEIALPSLYKGEFAKLR
jgi:hypothetical protein